MLLNDLPDDCLLIIFNIFNNLDNLINFSKVCSRWNKLISYRLTNVQYALKYCVSDPPEASVYVENDSIIKDKSISELLPNLRILEISDDCYSICDNLKIFSQNNKSIIGLIYPVLNAYESYSRHFPNLEIIVTDEIDRYANKREAAIKLKQIFVSHASLDSFSEVCSNLSNVERLHIHTTLNRLYKGPKIPSLKILELSIFSRNGIDDYVGFHFLDFCPSLQSAFFYSDTQSYYINESIKNENLRDLALDHCYYADGQEWDSLRSLLLKFPNLENLAIRMSNRITDENVKCLVKILPKIKLLDLRTSTKITSKAAYYLREFCNKSGRSIKLYHNCIGDEPEDWPKLIETCDHIVRGLDFMTHCFFRRFRYLPKIHCPQ